MNAEDILEAIGNVDGECVTKARERRRHGKRPWVAAGALAACAVLACVITFASVALRGASAAEKGDANRGEVAVESDDVWIYYVDGGGIGRTSRYLPLSPEQIFQAWREQNGIGDEVEFISASIDSNGKTTESEFEGEGVVEYEAGDFFILNLTVSKRLEEYYDLIDSELLLETLRLTMTGYSSIEYDGYNLILE